ncbi:MAG: VPLPA-CTERM sorting domain-containing protein [Chromatiales bacterium]|nr:VPLPA-CTERM sorting domain-containing protein [Chromatiales bacterium]
MRSTKVLVGLAALAAGIVSLPASAAVVTYCGPNVCYQYDNAQNSGLFGPVGFIGDSAYWTPTTFEARSADGIGIHSGTNTDIADQTWAFTRVYVNPAGLNPGAEIASIYAYEEGDYEINYAAGEVHGDLYLRARGLNNLLEPSLVATDSFDALGSSGGLQQWSMDATVTPAASLAQLANNLTLTIQNTLTAFTANTTPGSELAWIEKKLTLDVTTTGVVPVPAAAWLLGSAFGLLGLARRRLAA